MSDEIEVTLVTLRFEASDPVALQSVLAKYVVLTRGEPGCRNVDLCLSTTTASVFVVIEKWESAAAQRAHFDGEPMIEMAASCQALLAGPPQIDLLDGISAHDLA